MVGIGEVLGEAPVDDHGLAERPDEHVGGLEVAMDYVLAVSVGHGLGDIHDMGEEGDAVGEAARGGDGGGQRLAVDQLHRVEGRAVAPAPGFVQGNDAGVLQAGGQDDFAGEASRGERVIQGELLEGHRASQGAIARGDDAAETAAGDLGAELVLIVANLG